MRITPCESWPRRFARTSKDAIQAASSRGAFQPAKMSRVIRSSVSTSIVRMRGPPAGVPIERPARLMGRMREGEAQKIRPGVSACRLGRQVRHDGGHERDPFLTDTLGPFVEWIPVCPEVEIGLGVPRDTIRLVGEAAARRLSVAYLADQTHLAPHPKSRCPATP